MCSCRGPSACKQGRRIYNTLLLQAMALYIHGPLRCKNLLGRIPNPHSRPALAAPQHAPGPHSDARSQRTPPGRSCADQQHHTPQQHRQENAQRHPRTHAAHTHTAQIRHPAAHAGSCAAPAAPHDQAHRQQPRTEHTPEPFYQPSNMEALRGALTRCSRVGPSQRRWKNSPHWKMIDIQTARKPARPSGRTGFFFFPQRISPAECPLKPDAHSLSLWAKRGQAL